jgi:hypothetical protein
VLLILVTATWSLRFPYSRIDPSSLPANVLILEKTWANPVLAAGVCGIHEVGLPITTPFPICVPNLREQLQRSCILVFASTIAHDVLGLLPLPDSGFSAKSADSRFRRGATLAAGGNLGTMMSTIRTAPLPLSAETGALTWPRGAGVPSQSPHARLPKECKP